MNKKKILITAVFVLGLVSSTSAYTIDSNNINKTLEPGTSQNIGNITINNNNSNQSLDNIHIEASDFSPILVSFANEDINSVEINETINIPLEANVPQDFGPLTVSGQIEIAGENFESKSFNHAFKVNTSRNWDLQNTNLSKIATSGTSGKIGNFTISNSGNIDLTFDINVTGNLNKIVNLQPKVTVYETMNNKTITIPYNVPRGLKNGNYNGAIQVSLPDTNETKVVNVNATVKDDLEPNIRNVDIPNKIQATQKLPISVMATDNINVSKITVQFIHEDKITNGNDTEIVKENVGKINLSSVQNNPNSWEGKFTNTRQIGNYTGIIKVYDSSNNVVNSTSNFTVKGLESVKTVGSINYPAVETNTFVKNLLFTTSFKTPINVTLTKGNLGDDWSIRIVKPGGNERIISQINQTVEFSDTGSYYLKYQSAEPGPYSGELDFQTIEPHVPVNDVTFTGEVVNYTVPQPYNKTWTGGSTLRCTVNNTGIQSESYYECNVRYSLDETSGDKLIPIPKSRLDNFKENVRQEYQAKLNNTESQLKVARGNTSSQKIQKWIAVIALIIIIGYGLVEIRYLPRIRFRLV